MKQRGKYFWNAVQAQLDGGNSITQTATELNSTFNEIWDFYRKSRNMPAYTKTLVAWLEREKDTDAGARLLKLWQKVLKDYTDNFKNLAKVTNPAPKRYRSKAGSDPTALALAYGIKPSLIAKRLKEAGVLRESLQGVAMLLNGYTVDGVIEKLLREV